MRALIATWVAGAALMGGLCACRSDDTPALPDPVVRGPRDNDANAALADGAVTFDEYAAAYERFRACLRDDDVYFVNLGLDGERSTFDYRIGALGDTCYENVFQALDMAWQLGPLRPRSEQELRWEQDMVECALEAGLAVDDTVSDRAVRDLLARNGIDGLQCFDLDG